MTATKISLVSQEVPTAIPMVIDKDTQRLAAIETPLQIITLIIVNSEPMSLLIIILT